MERVAETELSRRQMLKSAGQGLIAASMIEAVASGCTTAVADSGKETAPASDVTSAASPPKTLVPTDWNIPLAPPDKQGQNLMIPEPAGKKLGWAIVGLGQLALEQVLPAFAHCEHSRPVALVSGHPDKAKAVAKHYGIDEKKIYNYDNYERLKDDPDVDVVYIILPNHMHAEYTIRALDVGKPVLCEKPMAPTSAECEKMIASAKRSGKRLMIAYRLRYEPFNQTMIEFSHKQTFGPIRLIQADNVQVTRAPNIRLSKETHGGALGDVGVYCLNASRYLTGEEPVAVSGHLFSDPKDPTYREVEESIVFNVLFPSGVMAHCSASFGASESRNYRVFCREGWYGLDPAFSYKGLRAHVRTEKGRQELRISEVNHFAKEMDHFSGCVMHDHEAITPGEEGLRDVRLMEKIYESCREGKTVKV